MKCLALLFPGIAAIAFSNFFQLPPEEGKPVHAHCKNKWQSFEL